MEDYEKVGVLDGSCINCCAHILTVNNPRENIFIHKLKFISRCIRDSLCFPYLSGSLYLILAISFYKIIKEETVSKSVYYLILNSGLFAFSFFIVVFIWTLPCEQMQCFFLIITPLFYLGYSVAFNSLILLSKNPTKKPSKKLKGKKEKSLTAPVTLIVILIFGLNLFFNMVWGMNEADIINLVFFLVTAISLLMFVWFVKKRKPSK